MKFFCIFLIIKILHIFWKYFIYSYVITLEIISLSKIVNIEDLELAKKCARGDEDARRELYTKYATSLYALCLRYIGDRDEARDLLHDSIIKIFDTIGKYKPTGTLKSWCSRVTVNLVLDYLRKEKRIEKLPLEKNEDKILEPLNEEVLQIPDDVLMQMVERLPQTKRVVFNLFCIEGYSHKDIAKMLKIKEKTSSSILFKARETLAEEINKYIRSKELL